MDNIERDQMMYDLMDSIPEQTLKAMIDAAEAELREKGLDPFNDENGDELGCAFKKQMTAYVEKMLAEENK